MNSIRKIIFSIVATLLTMSISAATSYPSPLTPPSSVRAQDEGERSPHPSPLTPHLSVRVGYNVGAATPLSIPATIRKLNSLALTPNFLVGVDLRHPLSGRWSLQTGLHFENKGMNVSVTTKGYHMAMVKGGEELEGLYTGRVEQNTKAWMLTIPLMGAYDVARQWRLHAGPYFSVLTAKSFSGNVADGYLRKDTPTGQKIEMGHAMEERATYDFSEHVRRCQMGLDIGADWHIARRLDLSADLLWGLTGLMHSSFKTVEQTLYPIYGSLSFAYQIK